MPRSTYQSSAPVHQYSYHCADRQAARRTPLHLLELAGAEDPVLRSDLVAEALADLGDAERRLLAAGLEHVGEVDEHALRGLGSHVGLGAAALDRSGVGLEHQVELARLGEAAAAPQLGQVSGSSSWSRRKRCLQLVQSTSGSLKLARWPDASHTAAGRGSRRRSARCRHAAAPSCGSTPRARCAASAIRAARSRSSSGTRRRSRPTGRRTRAACTG